jgi:DNA replication protein DnaC
VKDRIADYCRQLKLGGNLVTNYSKITAETHEEFLAQLLELEIQHREVNRKNLYLKQANFDVIKTFKDYSLDTVEIPTSITLEDLKDCCFYRKEREPDPIRPGWYG